MTALTNRFGYVPSNGPCEHITKWRGIDDDGNEHWEHWCIVHHHWLNGAPSTPLELCEPKRSKGGGVSETSFTVATVISAEGARVGMVTCKQCGAAILVDPRDSHSPTLLHSTWHRELGEILQRRKKT